jgi:hypothetical protein
MEAQQQQSAAEFLSSVEILSPFTREELERLAGAAEVRHYAFGDTICKAGEPAEGLYVVKSGSVRVFSEEHGKEISTGVRKAGEVFADIATNCRRAPRSRPNCGSSRARRSSPSSRATRWRSTSSPASSRSVPPAAWWRACSTCAARSARTSWKSSCAASASSAWRPARKS